MFSISIFDRGILSSGSCRFKKGLIVCFDSFGNVSDNFTISVRFCFLLKGMGSSYVVVVYLVFLVLFLIQCEYGNGLNVDETNKPTS